MSDIGSPSGDSVCRCDHTRGFAFLSDPNRHCYCTPSNEDCTCYKKSCPLNHTLTSDYQCKPSIHEISSCQDVSPVLDTIYTTYITTDVEAVKDSNSTQVANTSTIPLFIFLIIVLVSVIAILCILVFAEFPIIVECTNVSFSSAKDKTEVIFGESNDNVYLVNQEKTLDQGTTGAFKEKRKKYINKKEVALLLLRNRLSEPLIHSKGKNDVIVALEIGLTCSGIAVCLWDSHQEKLMFLLKWKSKEQSRVSNKTSTAILFRPNKTADSIGDDAEWRHCGRNQDNLDERPYYKNFMLTLCKEQEMDWEDIAIWDVQKKSRMKAVDIITSFIKNMKHKLLKEIFNGESNTDIQWVFTVPAI
ncbi:uncharacterized protein LOC127714830 [Mytilus californianus]|uniref:uncharacterized protein LOC127714830 n=1 Tax=Mytilus californianus TaxID=6549 RepID=UPI0022451906|nr:uncharacterized protein LOC127714830 [Mytilus californianus]